MKQEIIIRRANLHDVEQLLQFEQGVISAERPFEPMLKEEGVRYYDIRKMMTDPQVDWVVAGQGGTLLACGFARIEAAKPYLKHQQHAYLGLMYVHPDYRGKGINGLIIKELKKLVQARGVKEMRLEVYAQNHSAIKAYEKEGFTSHIIQMRMSL